MPTLAHDLDSIHHDLAHRLALASNARPDARHPRGQPLLVGALQAQPVVGVGREGGVREGTAVGAVAHARHASR